MGAKYLTAILYTEIQERGTRGKFLKYRNIPDTDTGKAKFLNDMKKKFPSAQYANFYDKITEEFKEQIYIE